MWPFDYFKQKREAKKASPAASNPQRSRHIEPTTPWPRRAIQQPIQGNTVDGPITPIWLGADYSAAQSESAGHAVTAAGAGGTFDGGGASGDWDDRSCSYAASDSSPSSDYSTSDSSSSCDSGSSGSSD